MKLSFAPITALVLLTFARSAASAELQNHFEIGRSYYYSGEFKKAISHFERGIRLNPNDAPSYFWLGKSYETLALIGGPILGLKAVAKAHQALARALQLAPDDREYREELFEFLLSVSYSRNALRQAEDILQTVSESDPDYPFMQLRLHEAYEGRSTPEYGAAAALIGMPLECINIARRPFAIKHPAGM
jgi:tetratricopeptide (TPR) repeat protein